MAGVFLTLILMISHFFATFLTTFHHCFAILLTTLHHGFATLILTLNHYFATLITTLNHCFANLTLIWNQWSATLNVTPIRKMAAIAMIATGIQFGWAIQFSTLVPYIQSLGVPHKWAANVCVLGQILGLVVQPFIGYYNDHCRSSFGRRRPFILGGVIAVLIGAVFIAFANDLGHFFGDTLREEGKPRTIAIVILVLSLSIFDVGNNVVQVPCRAFIGDLAAGDNNQVTIGNCLFSFFKAVGNILGYLVSSKFMYYFYWNLRTNACDDIYLKIKESLFISMLILIVLSTFALIYIEDVPVTEPQPQVSCFAQLLGGFNGLPQSMWMLMLIMGINWIPWFPFFLFNTDWMGHEVYGGNPLGDARYKLGVKAGSSGLMLKSIVFALMSFAVKPLGRYIGGAKRLWAAGNVVLVVCLSMTVVIAKVAEHERHTRSSVHLLDTNDRYSEAPPYDPHDDMPPSGIQAAASVFYAIIGIPLAINFSVPYALASIYSNSAEGGQGLYLGALNISILISEITVSILNGLWDSLFGGGNLPSFVVGAVAAGISVVLAIVLLPDPTLDDMNNVEIEDAVN